MAASDVSVPPRLGDLEAEVMEHVWRMGEATVRSVLELINDGAEKQRAYTTVMTVMSNLDGKGLLTRRREGKTDVYTPVTSREEYLDARARAEAAALVGRYGEAALMAFVQQMDELDPKRRKKLRRLARGG
ncbi:MAG: BlaI/MecI/CopY family transcriptional regulator [Solirubrobacteraceae bacterium]